MTEQATAALCAALQGLVERLRLHKGPLAAHSDTREECADELSAILADAGTAELARILTDRDFRWLKALCVDGDCSVLTVEGNIEDAVRFVVARIRAEAALAHPDLCRLSVLFNANANLQREQDRRINEWLKSALAAAAQKEGTPDERA